LPIIYAIYIFGFYMVVLSDQFFLILAWCAILGERCTTLFGYYAWGFLPESFSVKVKVLGGCFGVWLGENIAILSMVK
jgi:hypothetical protein